MIKKYCVHCGEELGQLYYTCSYSESTYGTESGTCDVDGEDCESDDRNTEGGDDYETDDYNYECPHCNHTLYPEYDSEDYAGEETGIRIEEDGVVPTPPVPRAVPREPIEVTQNRLKFGKNMLGEFPRQEGVAL